MGTKNSKRSLGPALRKGLNYVYYDTKRDQLSLVMRGELTSKIFEESDDYLYNIFKNEVFFKAYRATDLVYLGVL